MPVCEGSESEPTANGTVLEEFIPLCCSSVCKPNRDFQHEYRMEVGVTAKEKKWIYSRSWALFAFLPILCWAITLLC